MLGGIATLNWRRPKIFFGWWIVLGSGTVQFYTSAVFWRGFQAFVEPVLRTYTGWGSGVFGTAMAIQRAESSFITPFVGAAVDRFGPLACSRVRGVRNRVRFHTDEPDAGAVAFLRRNARAWHRTLLRRIHRLRGDHRELVRA